MQVLWLRYLTEINERTREVPAELLANPEVRKAVNALEESAFTDAQLAGYEKFWDIISVEKTLYNSAERRGMKKGLEQGLEQGREQGRECERLSNARKMKEKGLDYTLISDITGLTYEEIQAL